MVDVTAHSLTEFLQHSGRILPEVERGDVLLLRRRDGEDIVILTAGQWRVMHEFALALCARTSRAVSDDVFWDTWIPWLRLLDPADRRVCLEEIREALTVAVYGQRWGDLESTLDQWRATALATWDEQRNRDKVGYFEEAAASLPRPD